MFKSATNSYDEYSLWSRLLVYKERMSQSSGIDSPVLLIRISPCSPGYTEDAFVELQSGFMENHYHHFEDKDENKFIYTDIFKKHV